VNVGSLFSGAGLMDAGLARAGFQHEWFCEIDPYARHVLNLRWPGVPVYEDARGVGSELAPVDLLAAGFPCTDISVVGQRAGLSGANSGLWSEVARVVRQLRPRFLLVENVPSLLVRGMDAVLGDLAASGYDAEWDCLPAAAFRAPHLRARVWLLAYPAGFGDGLPEGRVFAGWEGALDGPWWASEPGVRRVDDGGADRVDRLRVLGNGVVAPIAEWIGRRILLADRRVMGAAA
jgi:DNA (cytosine-5)-methyltransferase 1